MTDSSIGKGAGGAVPPFVVELARNAPAMMWTFTATTFLSALLLFSVQPMFAKMVLPVLGGSPSVWAVPSSSSRRRCWPATATRIC